MKKKCSKKPMIVVIVVLWIVRAIVGGRFKTFVVEQIVVAIAGVQQEQSVSNIAEEYLMAKAYREIAENHRRGGYGHTGQFAIDLLWVVAWDVVDDTLMAAQSHALKAMNYERGSRDYVRHADRAHDCIVRAGQMASQVHRAFGVSI